MMNRSLPTVLAVALLMALGACKTPEEKAEDFYQSGLELLEAGEVEQALVEFRNVFAYNGFHKEARATYAQVQLDRGLLSEAYAQYLRLIEQYPDDLSARLILAELAIPMGNWDEVERHGKAAYTLDRESVRARAVMAALTHWEASTDQDETRAAAAVAQAQDVIAELPDNITALRVLIIDANLRGETSDALEYVAAALAATPDAFEFHATKLRLLAQDEPAAVAQLELMFDLFPDNQDVRSSLIGWHMSQRNHDAVEMILRQLAGDLTAATAPHVTLVQFLQDTHGPQAARDELDNLITANAEHETQADLYRSMIAGLDFEAGAEQEAIAALRGLTHDQEPTPQRHQMRVMLARMLDATGDRATAQAEIEAILTVDTAYVAALKMRAAWRIEADQPDMAITDLRTALSQTPRDHEVLTLMAEAHIRAGSPELAGERLALAVDVSDAAPAPALRYVQFLLQNDRRPAAETVLLEARRANPRNLEVASRLADFWLKDENWLAAEALVAELRALNADQAERIAATLEAEIMLGQGKTDESLTLLEEQMTQMDDQARATATVVLAQVRGGKMIEARSYLNTAMSEAPDDVSLRLLSGSLDMIMGDTVAAELAFALVLESDPSQETAARLLYTQLRQQGRTREAARVLDAALAESPEAATLYWIKAGELEKAGDIDGAIAIYETLYVRNSEDLIVANNLASLLATYKEDQGSLDQAYSVARRLRGMTVPAFQDTYGWIAARRGDYAEALSYLRPAAKGLPEDAMVQYHLGMTYAALGRKDHARETLLEALDLAGESRLPQFEKARATLEGLDGN
jgi:tetratricopeptide (TPR) repeat protein